MDERLLELYNTELRHLRETAAEFAQEFPKIAGRLALPADGKEACPDPYVERLLEGFAFLAARVHLKLDAEFPRFTQGLFETVYPDYLCPVPSLCVVRFDPEETEAGLAAGPVIRRGTVMRSLPGKGERTACRFTTAQDVRLLPLRIVEARFYTREIAELNLPASVRPRAALRLRLRKTIPNPWREIQADPLVFHLRGSEELPVQIYEQILAHYAGLVVQCPGDRGRRVAEAGVTSLRRVGFRDDEALLPVSPRSFEGYRLLREYFAFPPRFLFFELRGFGAGLAQATGDELDLVLLLDQADLRLEGRIDRTNFELFCTPAVNLFARNLDRVLLTDRFSEFHVVPDRNRPLDFEVYQIESVTGYGETPADEQPFRPFYLARDADPATGAFFAVHRVPRLLSARERQTGRRSAYAGTDVFLSLVDSDLAPFRGDLRQLAIRALCTNRHLPIQMTVGVGATDFTLDLSAPVTAIRIVSGPTLPKPSIVEGRFAWRLISHLALNYLSLLDAAGEEGARALRELLTLYVEPNDRTALRQIDGLRRVRTRPLLRRVPSAGPITFARGLEVEVLFDEAAFEGTGVFVLGAVLEQFFARYVSINSFTETVIATQQRKQLIRWPVHLGKRPIL